MSTVGKINSLSLADSSISGNKIVDGSIGANSFSFSSNDSFAVPAGSIAERPAQPGIGSLRYNTDSSRFEVYNGVEWIQY